MMLQRPLFKLDWHKTNGMALDKFYLIVKRCQFITAHFGIGDIWQNQCTQCVDSIRIANSPINPGTCLVMGSTIRNHNIGQCSWSLSFSSSINIMARSHNKILLSNHMSKMDYALDDTYRCVTLIVQLLQVNSYLLSKTKPIKMWLFKLVQAQNLYAYPHYRLIDLLLTCPNGTYATDATDRRCVTTCPYNSHTNFYGYNGNVLLFVH